MMKLSGDSYQHSYKLKITSASLTAYGINATRYSFLLYQRWQGKSLRPYDQKTFLQNHISFTSKIYDLISADLKKLT